LICTDPVTQSLLNFTQTILQKTLHPVDLTGDKEPCLLVGVQHIALEGVQSSVEGSLSGDESEAHFLHRLLHLHQI
jgi:hypothetical protein